MAGELASRSAVASQVKVYANFAMFPPRNFELVVTASLIFWGGFFCGSIELLVVKILV